MPRSDVIPGMEKSKRIKTLLLAVILSVSLLFLSGCGATSKHEEQYGANVTSKSQSMKVGAKEDLQLKLPTDINVSFDRKIIQNAELSLQVKDVPAAADKIIELNKSNGGYTVNSHIYRNEDRISANLSIKVPRQKLNSVIATVSEYGEINDKVISTEDVTEEYYDSEARLKVLKAKEERLLNLMNKANNIADIISIENELGQTRSEIEVLTGRLKYLSNATDYSLVNINLTQAVAGAVKAPQGTLGKAAQGLISSLNHMFNFASSLVVLLFILLPWILVITLLVVLFRYIYKKRKARLPGE